MSGADRRAVVAVAVSLLALALAVGVAAHYVYRKHLWATELMERIEPRYARLLGLRDVSAELKDAIQQAKIAVSKLGHTSDRDAASVGNDLQQVVRRALGAAGLTVASSQVLSPRGEAGYERIVVSVQAEGALSGVQVALAALQAETPRITIESLLLQSTNRVADDGTPVVSVRLNAAVLRLQS